ncbi:unnamed protein product [Larinioides sclopetarius]|uniref:Serine/arginine repetitive matrix protein 2-like n=1 Tax=Larinioides sclopetarius TaxID=280406 RepID=A0AAV2AJV1_9ARAC
MSFPPDMDQRITHNVSRLTKGRGRSRNVGNLHVINTSVPATIIHPAEYIRTVSMTPKRNVQTPEPLEAKSILVHKTPIATRVFTGPKDAAMSFTKKKINAAKNFLQQHNKESPVKKTSNAKVNLTDNSMKPGLSSNDSSSNLINNNPLPNISNNNMTSNSPKGSLSSNSSNNSKFNKSKPVAISHQSHSCLALYEVDMTLKAKNINATQSTPSKEKKDVFAQKEESGSSWVPVDMKKANTAKDLSIFDKNKISVKDKNSPSKNIENQNRPVSNKNFPKERKKSMKEIPPKMFVDSKGERTLIRRYSSSSRHFSSRQEEEQYYEKRYGFSRSSKIRRARDYEREHKRHYKESYPYHFSQKSRKARRKSFHEDLEALEDVSDVPLDEDFEEVETASMEDPSKPSEIPVGFRKYKIRYLTSKSIGFFKPKMYRICKDRTIVSCLNMEEESVDVVSEAEYEIDHTVVEKDSAKVNNSNTDDKLGTTSKNVQGEVLETANEQVKTECSVPIPMTTDEKSEEKFKPSKHAPDSSEGILVPTDFNNLAPMDTNLIDTAISIPSIKEKQEVISSSKFYYTCIPESDSHDFYQGYSLFQTHLDEWDSHLIGLEYILEVRDTNRTQAKKYHCGLCMEQLNGVNTNGQIITNHLSSYKHASAYMAKHFPSCGYKFSKNESSSNVLQKCCKEINHKLSYYFLCVTTDDYFQKHEKEVNELLNNLPHWTESDINIDVNIFVNDFESDIDKEVSELMKDMIHKLAPGEEIATFITSRNENAQELHRKKARNSILEMDSPSADNSVTSGNLIVLTPQHSNIPKPIPNCIPPIPKCIPPISKCSNDIRPNLLRVITHEETDSSIGNSSKIISQTADLSDQSTKDASRKTVSCPLDSDVLNFKSINKKAVSYRKYRVKPTPEKTTIGSKGTENKEILGLRTVRKISKSSGEITVSLESKNFDENAMDAYEEAEIENSLVAEEVIDEISNESGVQVLEDSTVESNFSDSLGGSNVISLQDAGSETAEVSKNKGKAKHRSHQRSTMHSKHCLKRILGRNSKSAKESTIKKESSDLDAIQLDNKSNASTESELERRFKDLSPADSKTSGSSRKITSPLRTRYSPVFSSDLSRISVRRRSRSPLRRRSRSPIRRRHSPLRRGSRSPPRRRSRSPRRHSRSPVRRRSRSPKRRSRSPVRRSSRSPTRRRSRSPVRRRSRSPFRRRSRSPFRRRSRSPVRRRSRSPVRRRSRSPVRNRSRSSVGRRSRSPRTSNRKKSRSPIHGRSSQKISTSPSRRVYAGESYVQLSKHSSPLRRKFESEESTFKSESRNPLYRDSGSKLGSHKDFTTSSRSSYPQRILHESERDLDPISDDEEPAYFNTLEGPRHLEEIKKLPEPTRSMVMQLLQKFSASKVTPKDPSFNELMQFVNSHNSEMSKTHTSVNQEDTSNMPTSGLALQRFLLSNLAETSNHQNVPPSHAIAHASPAFHSSGVPFSPSRPDLPPSSFSQPVFPPSNMQHHGPLHHPGPSPIPQVQSPPFDNQPIHTHFHPPQYDNFQSQNEPPSFQPKIRSDGMFKDLKATVNKLFGANEGNSNEHVQLPPSREFLTEQSQWGQDPRNSFNQFDSFGPKNIISDDRDDSDFRNQSRGGMEPPTHSIVYQNKSVPGPYYPEERNPHRLHAPPPDAKVAFCDAPQPPIKKNLFPVVSSPKAVNDVKVSLAQRLAAVLVKVGMLDVPGALLQEMLMKIGAFSACPPQDISEEKIIDILKRLGYLNRY